MKFINIIGTTGCGKSTLARKLAQKRQLHYIELDNLFWLDDWQESSNEALFSKQKQRWRMPQRVGYWMVFYTRTVPINMQPIDIDL